MSSVSRVGSIDGSAERNTMSSSTSQHTKIASSTGQLISCFSGLYNWSTSIILIACSTLRISPPEMHTSS